MKGLGQAAVSPGAARTLALLACLAAPGAAMGQTGAPVRTFELPLDQPAVAIVMPEGGFVRVSGTAVYGVDGSVLDAATVTEAGGARREGGLVDPEAGGLRLAERDPDSHTYTYHPSGAPGATCQAILLGQTCLVLRLPELAAERLRDLDEMREELTGSVRVEIHGPPAAGFAPTPYAFDPGAYQATYPDEAGGGVPLWVWAVGGASTTGLVVALLVVFAAVRRRRATSPLARAQAAAARLRRRLAGDSVRARLLKLIEELASEASALATMAARLAQAVREAKPDEIERRREELQKQAERLHERGGAEAGEGELDGAVKILDAQLERCRHWEMQRWRSSARLERIATRLEALEVELNDPTAGSVGGEERLLDALQEELDLARAGEHEAERLLGAGGD